MDLLTELLMQCDEINSKIKEVRAADRKAVIKDIRDKMAIYEIMPEDLVKQPKSQTGSKVPPKWKDPITGTTWSGRGRPPKFMVNGTAIKL